MFYWTDGNTTLDGNCFIGGLLGTTQNVNYPTGEMLGFTQDANYSTGGMLRWDEPLRLLLFCKDD